MCNPKLYTEVWRYECDVWDEVEKKNANYTMMPVIDYIEHIHLAEIMIGFHN